MKIIFLDIDGVLNSCSYDLCRDDDEGNIDKSRLPYLKELIAKTDAKIVLTSSWRSHWDPEEVYTDQIGAELEACFSKHGISLYDKTKEINNDRASEIENWLSEHNDVESFVILDNIKFGWGALDPYVVKTDYRIGRGLEQRHIDKATKILTKAE